MRVRSLLAVLAAATALVAPSEARAGDPIMPLGDVRAGMACTGYSVVRGTEVASFDVEVLDVVAGDPSLDGPRILVRASGPAVDATGIGPGFSGSPVYCRDASGTPRVIGAISAAIGEYGGRVVLANPIEAVLGTAVDAAPAPRATTPERRRRTRALLARARPIATPLSVGGLTGPVARALAAAGRRAGRPVLAAPAGPLGDYPVQTLRPGSALAVGYSDGDLSLSAIGTVAYTDGASVWGFGHPFEGAGRRALLLQDAYVFRVIANPNTVEEIGTTYKLASAGHTVGTLTNDALAAVAGRVGGLPSTVPVTVTVRDEDTGVVRRLDVRVADETDVDYPTGPNLPVIAPLALADGVVRALRSTPSRLSGTMCARIALRERRAPLRFCNRYVTSGDSAEDFGTGFSSVAGADLLRALELVQGYDRAALHVTNVDARVRVARGERKVALRSVSLPRRVRRGERVRVRLGVQAPRGARARITVAWRVPRWLPAGKRRLTIRLARRGERDEREDVLAEELGDEFVVEEPSLAGGPRSVEGVARRVRRLGRYDGLVLRAGGRQVRFHRDPELLITGSARATVRVAGRAQKR